MASFAPYVSEFEYSPESHPSRNPSCPGRWSRRATDERRSPDEGEPVGREPSIEIRAILVRCPDSPEDMAEVPADAGNIYNITAGRSRDILKFHGFDRDEPPHHSEIKNCRRKLIVTMKFNNIGKTRTREEFVVVDHVLDPVTMRKARLLNPFVFKVRQEQVLQLYGLKFQSVVNGEAREEVINEKSSNYTGCEDSSVHPTCGQMMFQGKPIPYSQGFCCSCDPDLNVARQPTDRRSETLSLGTLRKIIPQGNEMQGDSRGVSSPLSASPKIPDDPRVEESSNTYVESLRSPGSVSKRERSLKSSQAFAEFSDRDGGRLAYSNPSHVDDLESRRHQSAEDTDPERNINVRDSESSAELLRLDEEYEMSKETGKRVEAKGAGGSIGAPGDHSRCKDFRKLARDHVGYSDGDLWSSETTVVRQGERRVPGAESEPRNSSPESSDYIAKRGSTDSRKSNSIYQESNKIGGISSVNESSVTSKGDSTASSFSANTLREELYSTNATPVAASSLYPRFSSSIKEIPNNDTRWTSTSEATNKPRDTVKDRVIEYGNTHSGHYMNSQLEKPVRKYDSDVDAERSVDPELSGRSQDTLGHIADQASMEFESAGEDEVKEVPKQPVAFAPASVETLNNLETAGGFENLRRPRFNSAVARDVEELRRGEEQTLSNLQRDNVSGEVMNHVENAGKESSKSVSESDPVRGDTPSERGRNLSKARQEMLSSKLERLNESRANVEESEKRGDPENRPEESGERIEDESAEERWNRLDNLARGGLGSKRRYFRSIAYDDPFHRGDEEKQARIDERIEKEFTEITRALNESTDSRKNAAKLSSLRQTDLSSTILRDFAVMLNRVPKNDRLETAEKIHHAENGIANSAAVDKQSGGKRPAKNSRKRKGRKKNKHRESYGPRHSNRIGARSTTSEYTEAESQTNINEIVKRIIENDYRPRASSWAEEEKYSQRRKNIAAPKSYEENKKQPGSIFSLKSVLHGSHIGKIEKKCHPGGTTPLLRDDERFEAQSLPPDESTVVAASIEPRVSKTTTLGVALAGSYETGGNHETGSEDAFKKGESTLPPEETTTVSRYAPGIATTMSSGIENLYTDTLSSDTTVSTENFPPTTPLILFDLSTNASPPGEAAPTSFPDATGTQRRAESSYAENTGPNTLETEIFIESQGLTTPLSAMTTTDRAMTEPSTQSENVESKSNGETTTRLSSSDVTNGLKRFSDQLRGEKLGKLDSRSADSSGSEHAAIERSPPDSENVATTWIPPLYNEGDSTYGSATISTERSTDDERERLEAENSELRKELSEARRANGNGQVAEPDETDTGIMPTTILSYDETSDEEESNEDASGEYDAPIANETRTASPNENYPDGNEPFTVYEEATSTEGTSTAEREETRDTNSPEEEILTVYAESTYAGETSAAGGEGTTSVTGSIIGQIITGVSEGLTTLSQRTTGTEKLERYDTNEPVSPAEELSTRSNQVPDTSVDGETAFPGGGSFPSPEKPKGVGDTPRFNDTGGADLILVKTYSVSKNPRKFLDNYEFPLAVRRVLLKRLNVTAALIGDPVNFHRDESLRTNTGERFSKNRETGINNADRSSRLKYRRTVHEPSNEDLKLQQLREEADTNMQFRQRSEKEGEGNTAVVDFHTTMNEDEEKLDGAGYTNNEFVRNYGLKVTPSFATPDTLPPEDETTRLSWDDDVNATNFRLNYIMEEPIFSRQHGVRDVEHGASLIDNENPKDWMKCKMCKKRKSAENPRENQNRGVEFFYDYDSDPNANEVKRFYRSADIRTKSNDGPIIGHDANRVKENVNIGRKQIAKIDRARLKKREVREYGNDRRSFLYGGGTTRVYKTPNVVPRDDTEMETAARRRSGDGCDEKWQGKIDFLKLKKHQDILKEYLNWSPNVDTTAMRIFSIYSTNAVSPTTEKCSSGYNRDTQNSSTMSVVLIEDGGDNMTHENDSDSLEDAKIKRLNDKDILDKLSEMPADDDLVIISLTGKNKSNATVANGSEYETGRLESSGEKEQRGGKMVSWNVPVELDRDSGRKRNIGSSRRGVVGGGGRKGRGGRRLMSVVRLSENTDNGLLREEDGVAEGKEEAVERYEALPGQEHLVPEGRVSGFDYPDGSYKKHKRDKLKSNWDQLADEIMVNNNNDDKNNDDNNSSATKRNVNKQPEAPLPPYARQKSAMERLHIFDADKYIGLLADKINRLSNVENTEQDLAAEKKGRTTNDRRKTVGLHKNDDRGAYLAEMTRENFDDAAGFAKDGENRACEVETPRATGSRSVQNSLFPRSSLFGKLGSDFEISVSGKVHFGGEPDNRPMSISIDGVSMDEVAPDGHRISLRDQTPEHTYDDERGADASENITLVRPVFRDDLAAEEPEASTVLSSPRKTLYDVIITAHPRYDESPARSIPDLTGADESSEDSSDDVEADERRDPPESDLEKSAGHLSTDEPIFDFAKLELRHGKHFDEDIPASLPRKSSSHSRKRHARPLRRSSSVRHSLPGESYGKSMKNSPKDSVSGAPDTESVELIPLKLLKDDTTEQRNSRGERLVGFITSELPKTEFQPDTLPELKRTKIKPVRNVMGRHNEPFKQRDTIDELSKSEPKKVSSDRAFSALRKSPETRESKRLECRKSKTYSTSSPKYDSNVAEPCFGEKRVTGVFHIPDNVMRDNSNRTWPGATEPSRHSEGRKHGEEGKKLRSSTDDLIPPSSEPLGRNGETIIKGVEISSPGEIPRDSEATNCDRGDHEVVADARDSRKAVRLQNFMTMMNFVKKLQDILPKSDVEEEILEESPDPESVVEIQSVLVVPKDSSEIPLDGNDETERLQGNTERIVEIGEGVKRSEKQHRRDEGKNPSHVTLGDSTRVESLSPGKDVDKRLDLERSMSMSKKNRRALTQREVPRNGDEGTGFKFDANDELPEIIFSPVEPGKSFGKLDDNPLRSYDFGLPELREIDDATDEESPENFGKQKYESHTETRQDHRPDSRTRSPVTYELGVGDTGTRKFKGATNELFSIEDGEIVGEEKPRTRHLRAKGRAIDDRKRKKRRHKKHKKKKEKRKKWWPFKRNLMAILEGRDSELFTEQNGPMNFISEGRGKKGKLKRRKKRQIETGGTQVRGGQDCMDRRHPPHVNSAKYHESAHCLRFSDSWYSVYELETPITEHTVYLQLYEKHSLPDGTTHWDDLTQGSMIRLGSFVRHQRDSAPTISFTYSGAKFAPQRQERNLDPGKDRLLVPSPVAPEKMAKYPEVKGGSGEYLVVRSSAINNEGNECDKAGVGFATFASQPNRCGRAKGTCLKNQPLAYRRHDAEAREAGKPGCYLLSNFASVPRNPIKYNVSGSGSQEYLGLEYHLPHVSAIDVEVRADRNAIVRVGSSGRVTEVYVDSTAPERTLVTIVVGNMGLASSPYQSRIGDCPAGLPVSWVEAKGAMQVIPPQHDQRITLDLYGQLFLNDFHCSVEVVNHRGELVAMRRIRVRKMDRCFCVWHCLCACIGSVDGLGCRPMSPEHYRAAGFQGSVPVVPTEPSAMANTIRDATTLSLLVALILLGLGTAKWLIGIFVPVVGRWGLDVLLAGSQMVGYFEPELRCRSVVTDLEGRVVHPDTGKKTVRICSRRKEFFLNLAFFLTYPTAVCCNCARSSLANREENCCQDESKVCLLKDEGTPGYPNLIRVDTYGDSADSVMEAEDTRYVVHELKKSRDSLQDGMEKRCKVGLRNRK